MCTAHKVTKHLEDGGGGEIATGVLLHVVVQPRGDGSDDGGRGAHVGGCPQRFERRGVNGDEGGKAAKEPLGY